MGVGWVLALAPGAAATHFGFSMYQQLEINTNQKVSNFHVTTFYMLTSHYLCMALEIPQIVFVATWIVYFLKHAL